MMLQLADSIQKQGHIAYYNTGEESLFQVKMTAERLGLKGDFHVGQHILVPELLTALKGVQKKNANKQVFLIQDSLQTLDDGKYGNGTNGATPLRCVELLTDWCKSTYGIMVFIGQVNKNGEFNGKQGILHAVDIRGRLYIDTKEKSDTKGERLYQVTKNRFGCTGRTYIMGIRASGLYEKGVYNSLDD